MGELIHRRSAYGTCARHGSVLDEVVGPDVVRVFGPEPDTRAVVEPEPSLLGLLGGTFSPSRRQMRSTRFGSPPSPLLAAGP
jgi:hypothetical protein